MTEVIARVHSVLRCHHIPRRVMTSITSMSMIHTAFHPRDSYRHLDTVSNTFQGPTCTKLQCFPALRQCIFKHFPQCTCTYKFCNNAHNTYRRITHMLLSAIVLTMQTSGARGDTICPRPASCGPPPVHSLHALHLGAQRALRHEYS